MSVQGSSLIPALRYRDAHAAIDWLERVFGFTRQAVYEGPNGSVAHAQLVRGRGMLMLGSATDENAEAARHWIDLAATGGRETVGLCLIADSDDECEAIYNRVKAEGTEIVREFNTPQYGGKEFSCRDLEGHIWWVGSYNPWAEHNAPAAEGTA